MGKLNNISINYMNGLLQKKTKKMNKNNVKEE